MASDPTDIDYDKLLQAAHEAREQAYAPYSGFAVGAALLTGSGRVYPGCNIENAAYPACLCAERIALAGALAHGERDLRAMVVVAASDRPVPPCGTCRQVLLELAPDMPILLTNLQGATQLTTAQELLPGGFRPADLNADQPKHA